MFDLTLDVNQYHTFKATEDNLIDLEVVKVLVPIEDCTREVTGTTVYPSVGLFGTNSN